MTDACPLCARRAWLLAKLSVRLDFTARELDRLWPLFELGDADLIEALGGRRRAELHAAYAQWERPTRQATVDMCTICRHHAAFPESLREHAMAPHTLDVRGGVNRLTRILDGQVVAIVGTRRASDYGMETARCLARGLAACGVTIASGLAEGIPSAVHSGALEADGATLTVMAGGLERCSPVWCAPLLRRIVGNGCAISEVDGSPRPRSWWLPARARTLALLAQLVIVVEAGEGPWELACAHVAQAHGKVVAAVPGRVSSPASRGTNALLMGGARLVRSPQDALDLLYGVGVREATDSSVEQVDLEPGLQTMLARVGNGADTVAKLTACGVTRGEAAVALAELELQGLLVRGEGGRYVPSAAAPTR